MATSFMLGEIDDPPRPLSPDRHRYRTDTGLEALDFLRMGCRQTSAEEARMTAKRYPPVDTIKAARAKEKRQRKMPAEDKTPVEPIIIKSHLRRLERKT
jgi:hypothetical protein